MIRIAVELDVPNQEMLERVKQIRVPVLGFQYRTEDPFKAAILVA